MSQHEWEILEAAASAIVKRYKATALEPSTSVGATYITLKRIATELRNKELAAVAKELAAGGSVPELRQRAIAATAKVDNGSAN